jgi:thiol-disulfide isomerase/thioredoxin
LGPTSQPTATASRSTSSRSRASGSSSRSAPNWCKPCAKELPTWDKLAGELKGKVVFVAVDIDDEIDTGKKFHDKLKLRNMVRAYMPSEKSGVAASYGSDHMPSTFVADGQGVVRLVREGFEAGDADGEYRKFKDALAKLVK